MYPSTHLDIIVDIPHIIINRDEFPIIVTSYHRARHCSAVVTLLALDIAHMLYMRGNLYSVEMAAAVAIYTSKRHCDSWVTIPSSFSEVERRLTVELEWQIMDLEISGHININDNYGFMIYETLNIQTHDIILESILIHYIYAYRNRKPDPVTMSNMIGAYHLTRRMFPVQ